MPDRRHKSNVSIRVSARLVARLAVLLACGLTLQACLIIDLRPVGRPGEVKKADLPKVSEVGGDRVFSLIGPDSIPAIDDPQMVPADEADFMTDEEQVIGLVHGGVAKAYSIWHLDRHEIVNDWAGDEPIAVTW